MICTSMGKHTLAWMLLAFMIPVAALAILHDGNGTAAAASPNDISVSVSISKRTLTTGETAVLSVTVEGTATYAPEIPIKDLTHGPSSQVYIADGKVRQSISFGSSSDRQRPGQSFRRSGSESEIRFTRRIHRDRCCLLHRLRSDPILKTVPMDCL